MPDDKRQLMTEQLLSKAGGLLHSLVPRAQVFCFFDDQRQCLWSSDGANDFEMDGFALDLPEGYAARTEPAGEPLRRTLISGRTVLGFPVVDDNGNSLGLLAALFSKNAGKSSALNPHSIQTLIDPAIELLAESLRLNGAALADNHHALDVEREIELVYELEGRIHGASGRHSSLAELVGRCGKFLEINYSVLLIPSKRIRVSATHSSWKHVDRKMLDRYVTDHLMPKLEGRLRPVIFEIPPTGGLLSPTSQGYQALVCPIMDKQGNVEGALAQLGRVEKRPFTRSNRRFMSHIGRKIEYVIERSFDVTTGLMNRSGFETQLLESEADLKAKTDTHQIVYFDLDNLQLVNDHFGREAGDEVIIRFAHLLAEDLPPSGVLSRLTGDAFALLLTHADSEAALDYATSVRERTSSLRYLQGDKSLQITVSIGIAEINEFSVADGDALTTARMACEAAKDSGRDRIEIFDAGNRSVIRRYDDMQLVADIQRAVDSDRFVLLAQPIVALKTSDARPKFEILLRMPDGHGGQVSTKALFSAAERYRMMPSIDRWVTSASISRLAAHKDELQKLDARFAINLSGQSLGDDDILSFIEGEIENSGLPANLLCFEITESAAVSNLRKAKAFIERLRELGCEISLDDFGTGLSSFAYLKNFNVDTLKIDGGFVRDITSNRISESMVAAITQVAKVMGLKTIAEYVETKATEECVRKLGVDFAQGHVNGRPQPLGDVLEQLLKRPEQCSQSG